MCGILGYDIKNVPANQRDALFRTLAACNILRGDQSWGVVDRQRKTVTRGLGSLTRANVSPSDTLFAHTRWATHGKVSLDNCHPFAVGKILGMHNGVVHNHSELNLIHNRKHEVDSMHFMSHLDEGLDFDDIRAYGVLAWIKQGEAGTHLLRLGDSGELSVWDLGAKRGVVWSSNRTHAKIALEASGLMPGATELLIRPGLVHVVNKGRILVTSQRLDVSEPKPAKGFLNPTKYHWPDEWNDSQSYYDEYLPGKVTI